LDSTEFYLEVELHFLEATEEEIGNNLIVKKSIDEEELAKFKVVSTKKYKMKFDQSLFYSNYFPVMFD
jgi:hypothetical protein